MYQGDTVGGLISPTVFGRDARVHYDLGSPHDFGFVQSQPFSAFGIRLAISRCGRATMRRKRKQSYDDVEEEWSPEST